MINIQQDYIISHTKDNPDIRGIQTTTLVHS